jgi:hypothetical protein
MSFQIENPLQVADWNDCLLHNQSSFFYTSEWAAVLASAYGYKPVYFTKFAGNRLAALLPVMEINSFLTGKRGVSLPFTDSCSPIAQSQEQLETLISTCLEYALKRGWRSIEFRAGSPLPLPAEPTRLFKHHTLLLEGSLSNLKKKIRASTLRNIRRADRSGVHVSMSRSLLTMRVFHRLNCMTRKRHGLPPQPWYFFEAIFKNVVQRRNGVIFLASYESKPIAGCLFLHFRKHAIYKFGASDGQFHFLRANNLLMWKAIQHYSDFGYQSIDFGRTDTGHSGLLQYKRGWGTRENALYYYRFDTKRRIFLKETRTSPPGYAMLRKMPILLLRLIGHLLYPHVG